MAIITLQCIVRINQHSLFSQEQKLWELAQELVKEIPSGMLSANQNNTWKNFKNKYPEIYYEKVDILTAQARHKIDEKDYEFSDISRCFDIQFEHKKLDASISFGKFFKIENMEILLCLYSKEYLIVEKFGNKLFLKENFEKGRDKSQLLLVELNENTTIHTYLKNDLK